MSNYHYYEGNCSGSNCVNRASYSDLQNTTNYTCDHPCTCRFTNERSNKDKMYYSWFVQDQPMNLPTVGTIPQPTSDDCQKYI